jgi:hypothetical protein
MHRRTYVNPVLVKNQSGFSTNRVYRGPCGGDTSLRDDYVSNNPADARNGKCVKHTSNPGQIETEAHYMWRTSEPSRSSNDGLGPFIGSIPMLVVGGVSAVILIGKAVVADRPWSSNFIIGLVVASILILGLIIGGVFVLQYGQKLNKTGNDAAEASFNLWKAQEPAVFEPYQWTA